MDAIRFCFAISKNSTQNRLQVWLLLAVAAMVLLSEVCHADAVLTPHVQLTCPGYAAEYAEPSDDITWPYWQVEDSTGTIIAASENAYGYTGGTNNWSVSLTTAQVNDNTVYYLQVTSPSGIASGNYSAQYYNTGGNDPHTNLVTLYGYGSPLVVPSTLPGSRPGAAYSYEASVAGVNLINGNKTTSVPIVGWKTVSGLPVGVTLTHNSQTSRALELGNKWIQTYDAYITVGTVNGVTTAAVHWGDETTYNDVVLHGAWSSTVTGAPNPTPGHHDKLGPNAASGYDLITQDDQTTYHFAPISGQSPSTFYLGAIIDRYGYKVTINRANSNAPLFVTSVADPTGRTITFTPNAGNQISAITDPIGRVWTLGYDSNDNLQKITLPGLNGSTYTQQFTYNSRYDITSATDPRGIVSGPFAYDTGNQDKLVSATDAVGNATTITYNAASTVVTDANGNPTTYNFNESRLASASDPLGYAESYAYDYDDNVTRTTDKRNHASLMTYDLNGKGTSTTDANGNVFSSTYDPVTSDLLKSTETPNGTVLTTTNTWSTSSGQYNAKHLVQTQDPLGYVTKYDYYPGTNSPNPDATRPDLPKDVVDPLNHTQATYDYTFNTDKSYLTSVKDANSNTTTSNFSALGWLTSATDPAGNTTAKI